jgi:hypothetical protein
MYKSKMKIMVVLLMGLIFIFYSSNQVKTQTKNSQIRAAASAVNIEVSEDAPIGGWIVPRVAKGEDGKLRAQVVVFTDGKTKVVLGSADVAYLHRPIFDYVSREAENKYGIPFNNIMICATHSHGCPIQTDYTDSTADQTFNNAIIKAFLEAIGIANKKLENGGGATEGSFALGYATIGQNSRLIMEDGSTLWVPTIYKHGYNRPTGPFDAQLPVLAFKDKEGNLESIIFNHGTHNINQPSPNPVRSPSFFGRAAQELEKEMGGTIIFLPGAFGSTHVMDDMTTEERVFRAKDGIKRAYTDAQKKEFSTLAADKIEFNWRVRTFDEVKEQKAVSDYCNRWFPTITNWGPEPPEPEPVINAFKQRRDRMTATPEEKRTPKSWLQVIQVGEVAFVGIPGELFAELGLEIKRRSPFRYTYVVGIANDYIGYLPDKEAYNFGGYQTWAGPNYSQPGTGEMLVDQSIHMLENLYNKSH